MYGVFDNNKPASSVGFPMLSKREWKTHIFATLPEAFGYAHEWLGEWSDGLILECGKPYDYSGYGDMIEVRELPSKGV